jgi:hypothetical protein
MAKKKRMGRPPIKGPKRTVVLSLRLTPDERAMVERAAGEIPVGIWARIAVVRVAKEETEKRR